MPGRPASDAAARPPAPAPVRPRPAKRGGAGGLQYNRTWAGRSGGDPARGGRRGPDTLVNAPASGGAMELHRLLTFLGVALLVATFAIYYSEGGYGGGGGDGGDAVPPVGGSGGDGFSMAYVTGIAMLAVFMASFVLFNKEKLGGRGLGFGLGFGSRSRRSRRRRR